MNLKHTPLFYGEGEFQNKKYLMMEFVEYSIEDYIRIARSNPNMLDLHKLS
jgi:hypothetical protein